MVMHGDSTGRVVAACVVAECRRRVRRQVFQIRAIIMAMRQECRGRGLAKQAMQRAQTRIGEEAEMALQGRGDGSSKDCSLVANLGPCMQKESVGLYRALG